MIALGDATNFRLVGGGNMVGADTPADDKIINGLVPIFPWCVMVDN